MSLIFFPHTEDTLKGSLDEKIATLMDSAERFKAVVLDDAKKGIEVKRMVPREQVAAYNWEEIARVLREVREMPEGTKTDKAKKASLLTKLSEVYEVLRAAKMSKLEAVRIALISESTHLQGNAG